MGHCYKNINSLETRRMTDSNCCDRSKSQ